MTFNSPRFSVVSQTCAAGCAGSVYGPPDVVPHCAGCDACAEAEPYPKPLVVPSPGQNKSHKSTVNADTDVSIPKSWWSWKFNAKKTRVKL